MPAVLQHCAIDITLLVEALHLQLLRLTQVARLIAIHLDPLSHHHVLVSSGISLDNFPRFHPVAANRHATASTFVAGKQRQIPVPRHHSIQLTRGHLLYQNHIIGDHVSHDVDKLRTVANLRFS